MDVLSVLAPAKVNLFLGVGETRPDGYHDVTTVLHTLALADEVSLRPSPSLELACDIDVGVAAEDNLAWKAAISMADAFHREAAVSIEITKRVPQGAGLGGGSSDAAAVIAGLATMWDVEPLHRRCLEVAASLGADVPFFLLGGAALMSGRGDVVSEHLPAIDAPVVIVKSDVGVSTAQAYRRFDAEPVPAGNPDAVISALRSADPSTLAAALSNNLTMAAVSLAPEVAEVAAFLSSGKGMLGMPLVTGSGSAVFAICDSADSSESIARDAIDRGWWAIATMFSPVGVEIDWSQR